MYVSPAVRSLRDHPEPGESVRLHVRYQAADTGAGGDDVVGEAVGAVVADADGAVGKALQFGGRVVTVDQDRVGDLLDGLDARDLPIKAVETAAVASPGDAGEDVGDPEGD